MKLITHSFQKSFLLLKFTSKKKMSDGNTSKDSISIDIEEYGNLTRGGRQISSAQSYDKAKELVVVEPVDTKFDLNSEINLQDDNLISSNAIFHPVYDKKRKNCLQSTILCLKKPSSRKAYALIGSVFAICLIIVLALIPVFNSDNQTSNEDNPIVINNSEPIRPNLTPKTTTRLTSAFIPIQPETIAQIQPMPTSLSSKRATKTKTQATTNMPPPAPPIQPVFQPTFPNFVSDSRFVSEAMSAQPTEPVNFTFQDFVPDRRVPADLVPSFPNQGQPPNFN